MRSYAPHRTRAIYKPSQGPQHYAPEGNLPPHLSSPERRRERAAAWKAIRQRLEVELKEGKADYFSSRDIKTRYAEAVKYERLWTMWANKT